MSNSNRATASVLETFASLMSLLYINIEMHLFKLKVSGENDMTLNHCEPVQYYKMYTH